MFRFVIVCLLCVIGSGDGSTNFFIAAATVPPSGPSSSSWRGKNINYRRNEDVPIISDNSLTKKLNERLNNGGRNRRRSSRSRKGRQNDVSDGYDSDRGDTPPPYFFSHNRDDDQWIKKENIKQRPGRSQRNDRTKIKSESDEGSDQEEGKFAIGASLDSFRRWTINKTGIHVPSINLHFEPITTLKLRKSWYNVIPGAIIRVGADFETHRRLGKGIWRLRGCLEDTLIGGRFTIKEKRRGDRGILMEYSKSWLFAGAGK